MKKEELKKILRPLIKECIKEVIFEEGTLSSIISEVLRGTSSNQVVYETKKNQGLETNQKASLRKQNVLKENKKKLLDSIGKGAYNGIDLFEGTVPLSNRGSSGMSPQGFKDRTSYTKPSVKRRLAKKRAIARHKKEQRKRARQQN